MRENKEKKKFIKIRVPYLQAGGNKLSREKDTTHRLVRDEWRETSRGVVRRDVDRLLVHVSWQRSWLNQPSASVWCIYAFQFARRTCCTLHRVIHWQEYGKYVKKSVRDTQWSALIAIKDKAIKDKVVLSKALPMAKYFPR